MQSSDSGDMSDLDNGVRRPGPRRSHSTDDLIDGAEPMGSDEGNDVVEGVGSGDSPRLLVSPRKKKRQAGLKSHNSSLVSLALSPDQVMIL